ncbi:MAG: ion channel [Polyangiales bacterium]
MAEEKNVRFRGTRSTLPKIRAVGQARSWYDDIYHWILTRTWPQFFGFVGLVFLAINTLFACLYLLQPGSIANARPGSFEDMFFFSVQTLATIGYGGMMPATRYGHVIVTFEALTGIVSVALMTGITFAKFSRPVARILFSEKMVIAPRDGVPHLMFRMANWRHNQVVEAQLRLILLVSETTREGDTLRRPEEVPLVRDKNPMFALTWVAMHKIDESSPFFGPGALERLRGLRAEMFLSITGYDETIMQSIHARCTYQLDDIVPNARFADIISLKNDGTRELDYTKFQEIVALDNPS